MSKNSKIRYFGGRFLWNLGEDNIFKKLDHSLLYLSWRFAFGWCKIPVKLNLYDGEDELENRGFWGIAKDVEIAEIEEIENREKSYVKLPWISIDQFQ
jgi:hypothetical protein